MDRKWLLMPVSPSSRVGQEGSLIFIIRGESITDEIAMTGYVPIKANG